MKNLTIDFEGSGGEFQFYQLNKQEAFRLKEEIQDDHPGEHLQGGEFFDNTIFEGAYGPDPEDMWLSYDDESFTGLYFSPKDASEIKEKGEPGTIEYSYVTRGQVFGSIYIELKENEVFDTEKLRFECVYYSLSNGNREGRIISGAFYDGKECEIQTTDSGQDILHSLIGYFSHDGEDDDGYGFTEGESALIYETLEETGSAYWGCLDNIFK